MDAVKCIKDFNRMCKTHNRCSGCPLERRCYLLWDASAAPETIEALVATIEKWSQEHPVVTNGMKVRDLIPSSVRSTNCYPAKENALPGQIVGSAYMKLIVSKSWWDAEYKEGEK